MTKPTLYMLIGIPASGKSTWVKTHGSEHIVLSTDNYIEEQARREETTYDAVFMKYINIATNAMNEMVDVATKLKCDVIWDQTNLDIRSRKRKMAKFRDYRKVAVVFEMPSDNVLKERLQSREGKVIPEKIIESMKQRFQYPSQEEGFDEIMVVKND